jgi:hypothetical protein
MQFPKMIEGMEDMLSTQKEYKAYGDTSTQFHKNINLLLKSYKGCLRLMLRKKWHCSTNGGIRKVKYKLLNIWTSTATFTKNTTTVANGLPWMILAEEPMQAELVQQAGCLGGWCTRKNLSL